MDDCGLFSCPHPWVRLNDPGSTLCDAEYPCSKERCCIFPQRTTTLPVATTTLRATVPPGSVHSNGGGNSELLIGVVVMVLALVGLYFYCRAPKATKEVEEALLSLAEKVEQGPETIGKDVISKHRQGGRTAAQLKSVGLLAWQLKDAGYSCKELLEAGYDQEQLAWKLKDTGTWTQLMKLLSAMQGQLRQVLEGQQSLTRQLRDTQTELKSSLSGQLEQVLEGQQSLTRQLQNDTKVQGEQLCRISTSTAHTVQECQSLRKYLDDQGMVLKQIQEQLQQQPTAAATSTHLNPGHGERKRP